MADRRLTVLNPQGYQEILQTSDRLLVDSTSLFAGATFSQNVSFASADFSGNITVNGTPTDATHVATVGYADSAAAAVALTASAPLSIANQDITIAAATTTSVGTVRFATDAEAAAGSNVDAAVTPDQLTTALDSLSFTGAAPLVFTETTTNNYDISVNTATNAATGVLRLATDAETVTGTLETVAVNPKQLQDKFNSIPTASDTSQGLVRLATSSEADAGTDNSTAVTPLQVASEIAEIDVTAQSPLFVTQQGRVFDIDINLGTSSTAGILRLANNTEFTAGTATDVAITPAQLQSKFSSIVINDASTTDKGIMRLAFDSEVAAGTVTDEAVTPASLRYALDQADYLLDAGTY